MKNVIKKIAGALRTVFGYGITVCLFAGGLTFFAYVAALIIGGSGINPALVEKNATKFTYNELAHTVDATVVGEDVILGIPAESETNAVTVLRAGEVGAPVRLYFYNAEGELEVARELNEKTAYVMAAITKDLENPMVFVTGELTEDGFTTGTEDKAPRIYVEFDKKAKDGGFHLALSFDDELTTDSYFHLTKDTAAKICDFTYNKVIPVIVYATTILVLLGLLIMYLSGEKALTASKKESSKHEGEM